MFCAKCGKEISDDSRFCPFCGAAIQLPDESHILDAKDSKSVSADHSEVVVKPNSSSSATEKEPASPTVKEAHSRKKKKAPIIIVGMITVIAVIAAIITLMPDETDGAIQTVKSGYLGCYTDVSIERLIDYTFTQYDGIKESDIVWDGGTTNNGNTIVETSCSYGNDQKTAIQFTMLSDDTFKVSAVSDPSAPIDGIDDLMNTLNAMYLSYYMDQSEEATAIDKLNQCSMGAVLCGASKSFSGDREILYQDAFNIDPLDVTAAVYMNLLGSSDDTAAASQSSATSASDSTQDESASSDIEGNWEDSWSGRCIISITKQPNQADNYYSVDITWADDASNYDEWVFEGNFDASTGLLSYSDGRWLSYSDDGTGYLQEGLIEDSLKGELQLDGDSLYWHDFSGMELDTEELEFVRVS